ncbi:MAG: acyl-CoA desaturase [Myxococcales bacterium]|nr:acyl-CoA desaturase [Myxococcales bacterium]
MKKQPEPTALTREQADALEKELDDLHRELKADLGQADVDHIRSVIRLSRASEIVGRLLLHFGLDPLTFVAGTSALALSKILENMEIGHNVMHGQYDWTLDPALDSRAYEWDLVCAGADWREYHNYEHHTFTNVLGKDRDVGYHYLRVTPEQPWRPMHLLQPLLATGLAFGFQWGIAMHGVKFPEKFEGQKTLTELHQRVVPFLRKAGWQLFKDYGFFPALALGNAPRVAIGNLLANVIRNLWTFCVIFCGHFPEGVTYYKEGEAKDESRGQWYARQINGSANIEGGSFFHLLTGHLSHQIEHHLFPDLPASRYPDLAPRIREICARYGQRYTTGPFGAQLGSVAKKLLRLALPQQGLTTA